MAAVSMLLVIVVSMCLLDSDSEYSDGTGLELYATQEIFEVLATGMVITKQSGRSAERSRNACQWKLRLAFSCTIANATSRSIPYAVSTLSTLLA
jgi:hypothetical protein